jgi:hypothetical protein
LPIVEGRPDARKPGFIGLFVLARRLLRIAA